MGYQDESVGLAQVPYIVEGLLPIRVSYSQVQRY